MENQIPLPTDNIYKFYALFGLLLFVFGNGAILYETHSYNDSLPQAAIEFDTLKQIPNPTPVDTYRMQILGNRLGSDMKDRDFIMHALEGITAGSMFLMAFGFWQWHTKVQPLQDEITKLQLEKLRHEIKHLKH